MLTIPGAPWTVGTLSTAVFQVTQYKGVPHQAVNVLRSIAFVLEAIEDDVRSERLAGQIKESLAAEGNVLSANIIEAMTLIAKATTAVETAAKVSSQIAEDAAEVIQKIQSASNTVTSSATQLNETSTTYRDLIMKASTMVQQTSAGMTSTTTLNARVHAREGIKQRQVLVDTANMGKRILADLNNTGLVSKANEIIKGMGVGCIYAPYKVNPNIFQFYFDFLDIFHHTSMHPLFCNIYEFYLIFCDFISSSIIYNNYLYSRRHFPF